jgi:tetratricopeptide (TPR) repeat protein
VDTRDIDREVTGAALVCGDLLLGVALPGPDTPVLTASELLAVPEVRDILADHGLSDRADRVGSAVPADADVDLARDRLRAIASAPPPSDPAEYARLTDTCLGLARALPHELLLAAASSAERPGPLHAALDRLIADPETPVEVFMDLVLFDVRGLEAWEADMCAVAARRLEVADVSLEHEAVRAEGTVTAHHLAARLMGRQGRFAAGSDVVAALRGFLRELPDDEHDRYRAVEINTLKRHTNALLAGGRDRASAEALDDLIAVCRTAIERGAVEHLSTLAEALGWQATGLLVADRPTESLESASERVRILGELQESDPGSRSQDLEAAHTQRATALRVLGRGDEAKAAEVQSWAMAEQRPEEPTGSFSSIMRQYRRGKEHFNAGRYTEAAEVLTEAARISRARGEGDDTDRQQAVTVLMLCSEALFHCGRKEEALEHSAEAVDMVRRIAEDFIAPGMTLMAALHRRARQLYAMGRASALLAATTEIEDLAAQADLGAFGGVLAPQRAESAVLRVYALRFLGRHRETLEAVEAALGLIADLPPGDAMRSWEASMHRERDAMETALEQQGEGPGDGTGTSLSANSAVQLNAGSFDLALGLASEAIEILRSSGQGEPGALEGLAQALAVRARAHHNNRAFEASVADAEGALHLMRNGAEGVAPRFLAHVLRTRGWALSRLERWDEAVPAFVESVASTRTELERGGAHPVDLSRQLNELAVAYSWLGRHSDALPHAVEAAALSRAIVSSGDWDPDAAAELLGTCLTNLAFLLWKVGDAEAVTAAEEAVRVLEGLGGSTPARDHTLGEARQVLDAVRGPGGSAAE